MMSLPVWLPGAMFLPGGLWSNVSIKGSLGVLCLGGVVREKPPPPEDRDPPYGEERAVHILLECILVEYQSVLVGTVHLLQKNYNGYFSFIMSKYVSDLTMVKSK